MFIFIFATVGLLGWAAVKPWVGKWFEVRCTAFIYVWDCRGRLADMYVVRRVSGSEELIYLSRVGTREREATMGGVL